MKIDNIKRKQNRYIIYQITFVPNIIERLFGARRVTKEYLDTGVCYKKTGGSVYIDEHGFTLKEGDKVAMAIDNWRKIANYL